VASDPEPNPSPEAAPITLTRPATLTTVIEVAFGVSMATSQSAGWVLGRKYRNLSPENGADPGVSYRMVRTRPGRPNRP
jgi:hypothetical protein